MSQHSVFVSAPASLGGSRPLAGVGGWVRRAVRWMRDVLARGAAREW